MTGPTKVHRLTMTRLRRRLAKIAKCPNRETRTRDYEREMFILLTVYSRLKNVPIDPAIGDDKDYDIKVEAPRFGSEQVKASVLADIEKQFGAVTTALIRDHPELFLKLPDGWTVRLEHREIQGRA